SGAGVRGGLSPAGGGRPAGGAGGGREPAPLTTGERSDRLLVLLPAGEEEAAEESLRFGPAQAGRAHRRLQHGAALVELRLVLGEVRRLDVVPEPHLSGCGSAPAENRLEERRLAGAVRAGDGDVPPSLERDRRIVDEHAPGDRDVDTLSFDDGSSRSLRLQEFEPESTAGGGVRVDTRPFDPFDLLQLRLRLARLRRLEAKAF